MTENTCLENNSKLLSLIIKTEKNVEKSVTTNNAGSIRLALLK